MTNPNKHLFFEDVKRFSPLLLNLAVKDIKIKYRRSVFGVLWSILNPLLTMLVLTTVFNMIMRIRVENFATYYIVGYSIWSFFSESTSLSLTSVLSAAPLVKKVYLPKYIFPLEKCVFALINFGFSLIAVLLVMLIQGVFPSLLIFTAVLPIIYCFVFSVGLSLFLSGLTVYFRDIAHLYSVLLTVWFYLTPLVYPVSLISNSRLISTALRLNPMVYYTELMRFSFMGQPLEIYPDCTFFQINLIAIGFSLLALSFGILTFKKCDKNFILKL